MKFILKLVLIAGISAILQLFLPFWSVAIVALVICFLIGGNGFGSFLTGFLAISLLWAVVAVLIDSNTSSILSQRIANVLPLQGNVSLLILITAVVGGLVGGFGALTGSMLRAFFRKEKKTGYY